MSPTLPILVYIPELLCYGSPTVVMLSDLKICSACLFLCQTKLNSHCHRFTTCRFTVLTTISDRHHTFVKTIANFPRNVFCNEAVQKCMPGKRFESSTPKILLSLKKDIFKVQGLFSLKNIELEEQLSNVAFLAHKKSSLTFCGTPLHRFERYQHLC